MSHKIINENFDQNGRRRKFESVANAEKAKAVVAEISIDAAPNWKMSNVYFGSIFCVDKLPTNTREKFNFVLETN